MRRIRSFMPVALLAALLACQAQVEVTMDDEADIAAINAVREMEVSSIMSGDMSMAYAGNDVVIMPPGAPQVVGIEAARAWAAEFMAAANVQDVQYLDTQITVSGNLAVERYTGSLTMTMGGGDPVTETMKGVHVYRKGADGGWKMVLDVWNGDTMPMGEEM